MSAYNYRAGDYSISIDQHESEGETKGRIGADSGEGIDTRINLFRPKKTSSIRYDENKKARKREKLLNS